MNPAVALGARVAAAGCLATSGVIHAELYLRDYRTIPGVGPAFCSKPAVPSRWRCCC